MRSLQGCCRRTYQLRDGWFLDMQYLSSKYPHRMLQLLFGRQKLREHLNQELLKDQGDQGKDFQCLVEYEDWWAYEGWWEYEGLLACGGL